MGLSITAYSKITPANGNEAFDDTGELKYKDGWVQFNKNSDFPGRADDIEDGHAYKYGAFRHFYAGLYGAHARWRDQLAQLAGYPLTKSVEYSNRWGYAIACFHGAEGPFSELINFSDCEGVIGASVSAKLANDFKAFQAKADAHEDPRFRQLYGEWRRAFEMASGEGVVDFH